MGSILSPESVAHPVKHTFAPDRRMHSNWRSSFVGNHSSSESRKAIQSPVAARIPAFRAALTPPCSTRTYRMGGGRTPNVASVSSVDPSSTITISAAGKVCSRTLRTASASWLARLYVGMMTLTEFTSASYASRLPGLAAYMFQIMLSTFNFM